MGVTMAERKAVTKTIATRYKPDREVPQRGDVVPAERCRSGADRLMNSGAEMTDGQDAFSGRTMVMSGASRGNGLAIAIGAAKQGANIVLLAKSGEPHPKLPGTVHTAVADIEAVGGKVVPVVGDVRREEDVQRAVDTAAERFGGVDFCVNNASAIAVEPTELLSANPRARTSAEGKP
jgi:hypothetical protein